MFAVKPEVTMTEEEEREAAGGVDFWGLDNDLNHASESHRTSIGRSTPEGDAASAINQAVSNRPLNTLLGSGGTTLDMDNNYELIDEDPYSKSLKLNTGEVVIQDNLTCVNSGQHTKDKNSRYQNSGGCNVFCERCGKYKDGEKSKLQQPTNGKATNVIKTGDKKSSFATISSFKLELKHCEVGCFLQDQVVLCVTKLAHGLRCLEIPGLGSDELLHVIGT